MKLIDNVLYIEWKDLLECGILKTTLDLARNRKSSSWPFIDDPNDKRKVIIEYGKVKEDVKTKIIARFGDPHEYIAKKPIRDMVQWDDKAEEFFLSYRYDENKPLPIEHVKKYTIAVNWLNLFKKVNEDKKSIKKLLSLTIEQFYNHAIEIITQENIDLPTNYCRLLEKRVKFEANGYASLIDWRFGNKLAAKITDELSESALLEMIAHNNQFDDVFIGQQYNAWAKKNNYKTIDHATVGVHRRKNESLIIMQREGNAALNEKFSKQVKGFRPTAPMMMTEIDDNHLDLLFIDPEDNTPHKYYHRQKAIIVIDSYNDYVLGRAYAPELSTELVQAAWLDAMYYIRSITGGWHLPGEVKTDRWSLKSLQPFYESIAKYFPTPVGSKHRGYIEPFFSSPHWKRCIKIGADGKPANNYNGNNMTAKFRGMNQEVLDRNRKDRPLIGTEANAQIENFIYNLRHLPQSNKVSKHNQWMQAWLAIPEDKRRIINDEQFLHKFGIKHNNHGKGIRITNRGVEPQINGQKYSYDLDVPSLMEYVGKPVSVIYDPFDMSRVLVTDYEKVRIMGYEARRNSRALDDSTTNSRTYLNAILNEKLNDVNYIAQRSDQRKKVLKKAGTDAETLLQAGVMDKGLKQYAEQQYLPQSIPGNSDNYFDQM